MTTTHTDLRIVEPASRPATAGLPAAAVLLRDRYALVAQPAATATLPWRYASLRVASQPVHVQLGRVRPVARRHPVRSVARRPAIRVQRAV